MVRAELNNSFNSLVSNKLPGDLNFRNLDFEEDKFQYALETYKGFKDVSFYENVSSSNNIGPITDRVCVIQEYESAFFEAKLTVNQHNKENLANLMDFVADKNCSKLVACVERTNPNFKQIVASFLSVGFTMSGPLSLPGYVSLTQDL
eukprot:TRINITY_DN27982_c0_g1_i1.p2 TRINITY_DN27982_c0_g1~~TRINITY_DN27982_c0_g1_i1.p2  ORF type:complete len:148 (-),score=36.42 TRINITY_DN27982_c0_g1_i1:1154-1597(-)